MSDHIAIEPIDQDLAAQSDQEYIARLKAHINGSRRERTPEEDAEWVAEKRAEYEADRICGHLWSNW